MKVLIKPKVTKPWSKDMYDYNDKVADMMKNNIIKSIHKNKNNWDNLNNLMDLCGGIKYGDGFTVDRLPSRMRGANIFFVVTKIANDFSAGDWTTTVTGLMMVNK